jgi:hypothetical protein
MSDRKRGERKNFRERESARESMRDDRCNRPRERMRVALIFEWVRKPCEAISRG